MEVTCCLDRQGQTRIDMRAHVPAIHPEEPASLTMLVMMTSLSHFRVCGLVGSMVPNSIDPLLAISGWPEDTESGDRWKVGEHIKCVDEENERHDEKYVLSGAQKLSGA